jgi:hypothetical protein
MPSSRGQNFKSKGEPRDLAMFNLAIDSKLRGCDVVAMKVEDVRHLVDAAFEHADAAAGGCSGRCSAEMQRRRNDCSAIFRNPRSARVPSTPGSGRSTRTNSGRSAVLGRPRLLEEALTDAYSAIRAQRVAIFNGFLAVLPNMPLPSTRVRNGLGSPPMRYSVGVPAAARKRPAGACIRT